MKKNDLELISSDNQNMTEIKRIQILHFGIMLVPKQNKKLDSPQEEKFRETQQNILWGVGISEDWVLSYTCPFCQWFDAESSDKSVNLKTRGVHRPTMNVVGCVWKLQPLNTFSENSYTLSSKPA